MWCGLGSRTRPSVEFLSCEWLLTVELRWWTALNVKLLLIGVGIGVRRPLPPNRTGGFPAYGSPVGGFFIETVSPITRPCEARLRRRGASMCLAISTPAVLPSVGRKTSAPRTCLTPLNTSPAPSPVNASRLPSRAARASLGAGAVRYSFTVTDFHRLPLAGLPAHPSTHDPLE